MSQEPQDERREDAVDRTASTQPVEPGVAPDETQVIGAGGTRAFEPEAAGPDDPLSVFDQPTRPVPASGAAYEPYSGSAYETPASEAPVYGSPAYDAPAYEAPSYGTSAYGAPPSGDEQQGVWTRPPQPLVKTTPRTGTMVWGFIILAIGIGAIAVSAGARLDVGLAMIWLLAAAGTVLVAASVFGAVRRRGRRDTPAQV